MFPGVYGFHWEPGHLIFLGLFFMVLLVLLGTSAIGVFRSRRRLNTPEAEALLWKLDYQDLPREEKKCRYALTGQLHGRVCPNAFDCRECDTHASLVSDTRFNIGPEVEALEEATLAAGFEMDPGHLYHRGHTFVSPLPDGTVTIGLDPFAARLIGSPDSMTLPEPGAAIRTNGTGWKMTKKNVEMRVLAPLDGEVIQTGSAEEGWYLKVRPDRPLAEAGQLLRGVEVKAWFTRELERLEQLFATPDVGAALGDGGVLADDISGDCSKNDWDRLCSSFFLQP